MVQFEDDTTRAVQPCEDRREEERGAPIKIGCNTADNRAAEWHQSRTLSASRDDEESMLGTGSPVGYADAECKRDVDEM
jgi:hypothetical protein